MRSTQHINRYSEVAAGFALSFVVAIAHATPNSQDTQTMAETLSIRQQAIIPIAAFAAVGDMSRLDPALNQGLDAGLTVNDVKEVLVQLYAYAGFSRSLNALGEFMKSS